MEATAEHSFARFCRRCRNEASLPTTTTTTVASMDGPICTPEVGPSMNTDISGIGVRVSFYLQTLFLSLGPPMRLRGALYTLLFTNTAMAVTALILGFQKIPEITFHDGLVVFYLLNLSWVTVFFSLPAVANFSNVKLLHVFSILQSYTIFAFDVSLLITAYSFGQSPDCNPFARVVLFRPFVALPAGRIACLVITCLVAAVYTGILVKDHLPPAPKKILQWIQKKVTKEVPATDEEKAPEMPPDVPPLPRHSQPRMTAGRVQYHSRKPPTVPKEYDLQIAWNIVIEIIFVLIIWSLTVMNTELLIRWNHFAPSDGQSLWQFGQVLPMFLVVLPLANLFSAFQEHGLRPLPVSAANPGPGSRK
ncbi:hypothetical protein MVEN_01986100 [Mycena venus]|uniref:Uncharacterized protein n=1 Tax=Mycena venus TaxID=2733690 RepID=A0A8H6XEH3_9AGAR|nr:hypothetical protein MVEN_01986100 [Mycena venus]